VVWHGSDGARVPLSALLVLTLGLGCTASVAAAEPALGRVISIQADTVVVAMDSPGNPRLSVPLADVSGARDLTVGSRVRVWRGGTGTDTGADTGAGSGTRVSPAGGSGGGRDLTGVRARLSRGAGRGGGLGGMGSGMGGRTGGHRGGR
jgi:hypothetical protein